MPLWEVTTSPDEADASADAMSCDSPHRKSVPVPRSLSSSPIRSPQKHAYSPFLVPTEPPANINKNTSWFSDPGVWTTYVIIIAVAWLFLLSAFGCSAATAWIIVNAAHFLVTFYLFHWKKGSPIAEDQGLYDKLTWWEQIDGGRQLTPNRKFMTLMPVILYLVTSFHTRTDPHSELLFYANTAMVFTLVIAKLPLLHKVRIFGINL